MQYAKVIVNISHENLDKTYEYAIPKEWEPYAVIGAQVVIPFGAGNRERKGFILGLTETPEFPPEKIKDILRVLTTDTVIESQFIQLAAWIRKRYGATMNDALRVVLPVKKGVKEKQEKYLHLLVDREKLFLYAQECERKHYHARLRLISLLEECDTILYQEAVNDWNISRDAIKKFLELGIIGISTERKYRNPIKETIQIENKIVMNQWQQDAVEAIWSDYELKLRKVYLLHGVTGSGKTQVYLELIERVAKKGKQAIVLIPEISLTVAMMQRFYERFGDRVSVLHSKLSEGEKYDQYERAKEGKIDVMIGPRSALFSPFPNLGLIVVDEEHEPSYKSESPPKYHAREVAIEWAKMCGATVVLGSATPSVESYFKAKEGEYELLSLPERVQESCQPSICVVDLREELKARNFSIFSRELKEKIKERLEKKEQILLFLNRRGYAGFISCRQCGLVLECPHCQVSLTEHNNGKLVCHYCGHETVKPQLCPSCSSKYIASFGTGTEKIEELAKNEFPQAKILRMDKDTTGRKGSYASILQAFDRQEADILIGTQMIAKGHDFKNVTLVGALAADLSLYANDFRSAERTFQLLCQVAGRAGRRNILGEAIIQTYNPGHYSIQAVKEQNYEKFYEQEIQFRQLLRYPPLGHLLGILVVSPDEDKLERAAMLLAGVAKEQLKENVIGPVNAYRYWIKDKYRKVIYIKQPELELLDLIKKHLESYIQFSSHFKQINVYFDVDPITGY